MAQVALFVFFPIILGSVFGGLPYPCFIEPSEKEVPELSISENDIRQAFSYAENQLNATLETEEQYINAGHFLSLIEVSADARMITIPSKKATRNHRIQMQFEEAAKWLVKKHSLSENERQLGLPKVALPDGLSAVEECKKLRQTDCDFTSKFRTIDGSCNNIRNPNWGRGFTCYNRMIQQEYDDGISSPRVSALPNSRLVSTIMSDDVNVTSLQNTHLVMAFAQFVAHDSVRTGFPQEGFQEVDINCCSKNASAVIPEVCLPISIPADDIYYSKRNRTCMSFLRSPACNDDCTLGNSRRQINQATSYLDASVIYGPIEEDAKALRSFHQGGLLSQVTPVGELLSPSRFPDVDQCTKLLNNSRKCFQSGDPRNYGQFGLTVMHTYLHREHNRIARILATEYPTLSDELIYQETRRIVAAEMQAVVYGQYLASLVGADMTQHFGLDLLQTGFTEYNPDLNPSTLAEYAVVASRFGHSAIQRIFQKVSPTGDLEPGWDLDGNQFNPTFLYEGMLDTLATGLYRQGMQVVDRHYVEVMTNKALEVPGKDDGLDTLAIDSQRSREQGLPSYTKMFQHCYNISILSFDDLKLTMSNEDIDRLKKAYRQVADIDIKLGTLSERSVNGGSVGPTNACIFIKQFLVLKFGDRFYFEHKDQAGSFTEGQLKELRKATMSSIICANSNMTEITPNVFLTVQPDNAITDCNAIPSPDFTNWLDKK